MGDDNFYQADPTQVYGSGALVESHTDDATALAGQYLRSLTNATDWVKHPTVIGAIERYHATWQPKVNQVAADIETLGSNTSASATTVAQGDVDSTGTLTALSRGINSHHNIPL